MKIVKYIAKSLFIGVVAILVFNLIGQFFNIKLPFSILSVLLVGFFRIPGLIILLIYLIL